MTRPEEQSASRMLEYVAPSFTARSNYEFSQAFAREHGLTVVETSAKDNQGVEEMFYAMARKIKERLFFLTHMPQVLTD